MLGIGGENCQSVGEKRGETGSFLKEMFEGGQV